MKTKTDTYMRPTRWMLIAGLGSALLLAIAIQAQSADRQQEVQTAQASYLLVNTARLETEIGYAVKRRYIGIVEADQRSQIGFELAGKIQSIRVDEGQQVAKGELLAELDTERLTVRRKELLARASQIKTELALANATLARLEKAISYEGVTTQRVDEAKYQRDAAQAGLNTVLASIDAVDIEISKSSLLAPYDATVVARLLDSGNVVNAGQPLLSLQQTTGLTARIGLAGNAIDYIWAGQQVDVLIEGANAQASVRSILPVRNAMTRVVDVILTLNDEGARPGDLVEMTVTEQRQASGYWVPLTALSEGERGTWTLLMANQTEQANAYKLSRRFVEVLYQEAGQAFIKRFEQDSSLYVVNGLQRVVPGQIVRVNPAAVQFIAGGK